MAKAEWKRTTEIIDAAAEILAAENPMTLRQCFYRLVSIGALENTKGDYQALSSHLTKARADGRVEYEWITDRSRPEYSPWVFADPAEYIGYIRDDYQKDYWQFQPWHIEVWTEKDAIIGAIEPFTKEFRVTVRVGRGFQSTTRVHEIAEHFKSIKQDIKVFYLGDHDPSGRAIEEDLASRVKAQGAPFFHIKRLAIHQDDISEFNLPPLRVKDTDTRAAGFVTKYGTDAVELDALPVTELRSRLHTWINAYIDQDLWNRAVRTEQVELASITNFMDRWKNLPVNSDQTEFKEGEAQQ